MTSRIDGALVSSITMRSMPMPSPAVGGRPYPLRAGSRRRSTSPPRRPRPAHPPAPGSAPPGLPDRSIPRSRWPVRVPVMNNSKRSVTDGLASFARASGDTSVRYCATMKVGCNELRLPSFPRRASAAARPTPSVRQIPPYLERRQRRREVFAPRRVRPTRYSGLYLMDRLRHRQAIEWLAQVDRRALIVDCSVVPSTLLASIPQQFLGQVHQVVDSPDRPRRTPAS